MLIIPGSIHIGVHFLFLFLDDLFLFFVLEGNEYGFILNFAADAIPNIEIVII